MTLALDKLQKAFGSSYFWFGETIWITIARRDKLKQKIAKVRGRYALKWIFPYKNVYTCYKKIIKSEV